MTPNTIVHLATGFEEIEAVTIIDVLRRAGFEVTVVSVTDHLKVTGAHRITLEADQLFEAVDYSDVGLLILPGGMPGTTNLSNHKGLTDKINQFNQENKYIGAICAAPMILGINGLLIGKKAVCYPGFEEHLEGSTILNEPFALDGHIITGKGVGAALEFSLEIVKIFKGDVEATKLRTALVMNSTK